MNKVKCFLLLFLIIIFSFGLNLNKDEDKHYTSLRFSNSEDVEIEENIEEQLKDLDFSKIDKILNNFDNNEKNVIKADSFLDVVKNLIYSSNVSTFEDVVKYIINVIFNEILNYIPYLILIFLISILYGIIDGSTFIKNDGTKRVVYISCVGACCVIIFKIVFDLITNTTSTINSVANLLEILLPIILTLIVSLGGTNTATIFQPTLAIFCNVVTKLFVAVLLPIFIFSIIFNIVGNLYTNVKLEKFSKFLNSLFKSIIGIVFTIFIAFLSIQGLTSSTIDGISIKTAKYAIKNYIPILGSYLSDGVGLILLSTSIIKNAVGAAGLVVFIFLILKPIIKILILTLMFKLFSAILEVISKDNSKLLEEVSKSLSLLNLCLISVGLMAIISVSILLSVSNVF